MDLRLRHPAFTGGVAFVVLTTLFLYSFRDPHHSGPDERFLGKWTEPAGEPGNSIEFGLTRVELPGSPLDAYEGWVEFRKQLGQEKTRVSWNYGYWDVLQLNVTVPGKSRVAYVRTLNNDHMLIHFLNTIPNKHPPNVFESPEVKAMVRVRDADR
jgi:hypothetical protein